MPVGLVSDSDFQRELESYHSPDKSIPVIQGEIVDTTENTGKIVEKPTRGRKDGDVNVPDSLRAIIGETAVIEGREAALKLASEFGVSPSSVSAYANGATSTKSYDTPKSSIIAHIQKSRARAIKRASKTLNGALGAITQEKLDYADARDLSGIAKDMSVIIKNLEPEKAVDSDDVNRPQFVIFAPQFRDERSFEVVQVKE